MSADEVETSIETTVDEEGNSVTIRASEAIHAQIKKLLQELDLPVDSTESPYQFYKLRNANATEVLFTLLALQQVTGTTNPLQAGGLGGGAFGTLGGLNVGGVNPGLGMGLGGFPGLTGLGGGLGATNQPLQMPPGTNLGDQTAQRDTTANRNLNSGFGPGDRSELGSARRSRSGRRIRRRRVRGNAARRSESHRGRGDEQPDRVRAQERPATLRTTDSNRWTNVARKS